MKHIFVRLDVDYADNPKMMRAGELAELLFVRAICHCRDRLTDGFVPEQWLVRTGLSGVKARADALVREGLWERVAGGYQVVGYLERNASKADIEAELERRSAAGRIAGQRSGEARRQKPRPAPDEATLAEFGAHYARLTGSADFVETEARNLYGDDFVAPALAQWRQASEGVPA